ERVSDVGRPRRLIRRRRSRLIRPARAWVGGHRMGPWLPFFFLFLVGLPLLFSFAFIFFFVTKVLKVFHDQAETCKMGLQLENMSFALRGDVAQRVYRLLARRHTLDHDGRTRCIVRDRLLLWLR